MRLELRGITEMFGPLVANDHTDLTVEPGEIHTLLRENSAGKSTLMNILYGLYKPDTGEIFIDEKPVTFKDPGDTVAAGIGMMHQHFMLIPVFTVAESVTLGYEPTKGVGILNLNSARKKVWELSARSNFDIDPDSLIKDLPVDTQQRVEIIKALSREAKMLILDKPMAVLTPQETDKLIEIIRQLKASGTSIIFITHKLREIEAAAEEIMVIRRGEVVGYAKSESTDSELAVTMARHEVKPTVEKVEPKLGDVVFEMKRATATNETRQMKLGHIDLKVHSDEALAVAGVQGSDQTELCHAILGLQPLADGSISLAGEDLFKLKVKTRLGRRLGYVPEDRSVNGIIASFFITENMILDQYDRPPFATGINMHPGIVAGDAEELREEYDMRVTSTSGTISTLSGGNQQKAILAHELSRPLKLPVASQPTRGLDIGSIEFVHKRIVEQRDAGTGVILVSTELGEVMGLADHIAVMYRGEVIGIVPPDTSRDVLGLMMAGIPLEEQESAE